MSTTTKPELVAELIIPARAGRLELRGFFPRIPWKQVIVEEDLLGFVANTKHYGMRQALECCIESVPFGGVLSDLLEFTDKTTLSIDKMCVILAYLGDEGWPLLAISSPEEESNILIGYVRVNEKYYGLVVEHEFNDGKEEIYLNMRETNHEEDDSVLVLHIISDIPPTSAFHRQR